MDRAEQSDYRGDEGQHGLVCAEHGDGVVQADPQEDREQRIPRPLLTPPEAEDRDQNHDGAGVQKVGDLDVLGQDEIRGHGRIACLDIIESVGNGGELPRPPGLRRTGEADKEIYEEICADREGEQPRDKDQARTDLQSSRKGRTVHLGPQD